MQELEEKNPEMVFLLRVTAVVCFYVAAVSVLDAFMGLFSYWAYVSDKVDAAQFPEWFTDLQEINKSPYSFLALSLYNIMLWNGVILCSIWLLRYHNWARKTLQSLLGFDMIVTVTHLLWNTYTKSDTIEHPWWYIFFNILQVLAIFALSYPQMVELTEQRLLQRENLYPPSKDSKLR